MGKPKSLREAAAAVKPPIDLNLPHESVPAVRLAQTARAQQVMREEMEAGVHKPKPITPEGVRAEKAAYSRASDILDEEIGRQLHNQADIARMAHLLIEEHGQGLYLSLKQWALVQAVVEAAVRVDPNDL